MAHFKQGIRNCSLLQRSWCYILFFKALDCLEYVILRLLFKSTCLEVVDKLQTFLNGFYKSFSFSL